MTLKDLIKLITEEVVENIQKRITGHVDFSVNLSQGGIGNCNIKVDKLVK